MAPLHLHRTDDEVWYVLDGVESDAGARWLVVCTPGDFEQFVVAAGRPAERNELPPPMQPTDEQVAAVTRLAAEHGIELLGPPGALPGTS